jgi:hypothetical protein
MEKGERALAVGKRLVALTTISPTPFSHFLPNYSESHHPYDTLPHSPTPTPQPPIIPKKDYDAGGSSSVVAQRMAFAVQLMAMAWEMTALV